MRSSEEGGVVWVLGRLLAMIALGAVGAIVGGFLGTILTFGVMGLGGLFGAPIGFVIGVVVALRVPVRDAAIIFVVSVSVAEAPFALAALARWESMLALFVSGTFCTIAAFGLLELLPRWPSPRSRLWLAGSLVASYAIYRIGHPVGPMLVLAPWN